MNKKERKECLVKVSTYLRSGVLQNDKSQIIEAYRWLEDLMNDHGIFCFDEPLPQFPKLLKNDTDRLDWLADVNNKIGNVLLPAEIVLKAISLRDAIDKAMELKN